MANKDDKWERVGNVKDNSEVGGAEHMVAAAATGGLSLLLDLLPGDSDKEVIMRNTRTGETRVVKEKK